MPPLSHEESSSQDQATLDAYTDMTSVAPDGFLVRDASQFLWQQMSECIGANLFNLIAAAVLVPLGLGGNAVIMAILREDTKKMDSVYLLFYLAVADSSIVVLLGLLQIFQAACALSSNRELFVYHYIIVNTYVGYVLAVAKLLVVTITVLVMAHRYFGVFHPYRMMQWKMKFNVRKQLIATLLFSIIYNLPRLFDSTINSRDPKTGLVSHSLTGLGASRLYQLLYSTILFYSVYFLIPVCSLIYMTCALLKYFVKKQKAELPKHAKISDEITHSLIAIVIIFILASNC